MLNLAWNCSQFVEGMSVELARACIQIILLLRHLTYCVFLYRWTLRNNVLSCFLIYVQKYQWCVDTRSHIHPARLCRWLVCNDYLVNKPESPASVLILCIILPKTFLPTTILSYQTSDWSSMLVFRRCQRKSQSALSDLY